MQQRPAGDSADGDHQGRIRDFGLGPGRAPNAQE